MNDEASERTEDERRRAVRRERKTEHAVDGGALNIERADGEKTNGRANTMMLRALRSKPVCVVTRSAGSGCWFGGGHRSAAYYTHSHSHRTVCAADGGVRLALRALVVGLWWTSPNRKHEQTKSGKKEGGRGEEQTKRGNLKRRETKNHAGRCNNRRAHHSRRSQPKARFARWPKSDCTVRVAQLKRQPVLAPGQLVDFGFDSIHREREAG